MTEMIDYDNATAYKIKIYHDEEKINYWTEKILIVVENNIKEKMPEITKYAEDMCKKMQSRNGGVFTYNIFMSRFFLKGTYGNFIDVNEMSKFYGW